MNTLYLLYLTDPRQGHMSCENKNVLIIVDFCHGKVKPNYQLLLIDIRVVLCICETSTSFELRLNEENIN